jgi:phosphate-selective porin OprO/OprP
VLRLTTNKFGNYPAHYRWLFPAFLLLSAPFARSGETVPAPTPAPVKTAEENTFDKIWALATLHKNDKNPFIEEFKLRGRYHGQYHWLDSDHGNDDGWENRRSRFGFDAKLFNKQIEVRLDAQSNDKFDPFYESLVDAFIKWKPTSSFNLTVGRQKPQIGYYDFLQSTINQPTFERSQIFNQLRVDRVPGAVADGKVNRFTWQAGVYSNQVDREFGQFEGAASFGAGIGYDLKENFDLEKADWRVDWIHSDHNAADTIFDRYDNLFSTTLWLKDHAWSLATEAFAGAGAANGDVFGFFIQPTYDLVPKKLQLVSRYTFSCGDGPDSLTAQSRYERDAPDLTGGGKGNTYHAGYLGLQYFIYGDQLKLMAGAEYAHLDGGGNGGDFDGLTVLTGIRVAFYRRLLT